MLPFPKLILVTLIYQITISSKGVNSETRYEPTWESLDTRPLPHWYDEAKFGIFLHWGVFSVPSFGSEWFWFDWKNGSDVYKQYVDFIDKNYPKGFSYQEFAKDFTAEFFDPHVWADLFSRSGAKYVILTSKHHEGFTLWPSKYSFSWNAKDIGPHRDLVGDLATAVRNKNITFGLYHSLYEWFNPVYVSDRESNFTKREFIDNKVLPEMYELVNTYKPDVFWSDGEGEAYDTYWNSTGFLAWLYNDSPVKDTIVVNDRWGIGIPCHHGDFFSCADRYNPGTLQLHKWENAMTIDKSSWGFRRNANLSDYLTTHELLGSLAQTVSCGGNLLLNVGPTKDGLITPIFEERLLEMGQWLEINGEAIFKSTPWTTQKDDFNSNVWYTLRDSNVYAVVLEWPNNNTLSLESVEPLFNSSDTTVNMLGNEGKLKWTWSVSAKKVDIIFPDKATVKSKDAWVLKIHYSS